MGKTPFLHENYHLMSYNFPIIHIPPEGAVGVLFDANGNAEGALVPFEEEVRAAGDKEVPWRRTD